MRQKIIMLLAGLLATLVVWAQKPAELSKDYSRFGLNPAKVDKWEDGTRTKGAKGTYEWWYFDFKLSDGTTMVIDFLTKPVTNIETGPKPLFFVDIVKPNGEKISKKWSFDVVDFYVATDSCYVQMGNSYVKGNLKKYIIHIDQDGFKLDLTLTSEADAWRPYTGHIVFDYNKFFGWLVAVPKGTVTGKYVYQGKTKTFKGSGYHDHNWGNVPMDKVIHHWYWSRADFGEYSVIAADVVSEKQFGYKDFKLFAVFKDGKVINDIKKGKTNFFRSEEKPLEGKPVSDKVMFVHSEPQDFYFLTLRKTNVLSTIKLVNTFIENPTLAKTMEKAGYDATYYRFAGKARLLHLQNGQLVLDKTSDKLVWEIMYFGKCID